MERNFSMRKRKSIFPKIFLTAFIIIIAVLILYMFYPKNEPTVADTPVAARSEPVLNEDSVTKIKTLYKCGHEKNETKRSDSNFSGKTRQEIELMHPEWKITKFTREEVDAEITVNKDCDNHYFIQLIGNQLHVYKTSNPDKILRKKEINLNVLTGDDIKTLITGIKTDSEFEMLEILESFSE